MSEDQSSKQYTVSGFQSEADTIPFKKKYTWPELASLMAKPRVRNEKKGTMCFSPVEYHDGARRGLKGVSNVCMAVFDFDHGLSVEEAKQRFAGYRCIIHSSFSHIPDKPKFRVIVPLSHAVPAAQWSQLWDVINNKFGGLNDPAVKDASRLYYLYCHPKGSEDHFCYVQEGYELDVDTLTQQIVESHAQVVIPAAAKQKASSPSNLETAPSRKSLNPAAGFNEVLSRCNFMVDASNPDKQDDLSEPLWKGMIANAACFEKVDEWIHRASCEHSGYVSSQTDAAIARFRQGAHGPTRCSTIQRNGYTGCPQNGCQLPSGVDTKAPAGLGVWANSGAANKPNAMSSKKSRDDEAQSKWMGLTKSFIKFVFPHGLVYENEMFWGYQNGYWKVLDDKVDIGKPLLEFMESRGALKKGAEDQIVLRWLKLLCSQSGVFGNQVGRYICLNNGTLSMDSFKLKAHSPDHYLRNHLDVAWDPLAGCPRFMQFLDEIFAPDIDKQEKIRFLQQWIGYCLVADNRQHKFLWLVGWGGNGKSVLLELITHLVGKENVSNAQIERLGEKFVRAELDGKLVNISSEMGAEATISDGYLKAIVAGDDIEAERKYKPSFTFKPVVRLIGATNYLPRLLDLTDGFFRRAIILNFNRQFGDQERNPNLIAELKLETAGVLAWAVAGYQTLQDQKRFLIPASSVAALVVYKKESDVIGMFADAMLTSVQSGGVKPTDLYDSFVRWVKERGYHPSNMNNFCKRLKVLGYVSVRSGGVTTWRVNCSHDFDSDDNLQLNHIDEPEVVLGVQAGGMGLQATRHVQMDNIDFRL